jgi:hypothetical protein
MYNNIFRTIDATVCLKSIYKNWLNTPVVSPAYGYIGLALVKCSNDGGPGPRHNMKEDPGSSIFGMLVVYGYYLHLLTSSQNQVTGRTSGDPLPPLRPAWAKHPLLPLLVPTPPPAKDEGEASLGEIILRPLIRGRRPRIGLEEDVETILGFSAPLYEVRELSWRPAQVDQRASS